MKETATVELDLHFLQIDLENLKTIKDAVHEFSKHEACLDLLINNAGVWHPSCAEVMRGTNLIVADHEHSI